jgi:hypothetical protein
VEGLAVLVGPEQLAYSDDDAVAFLLDRSSIGRVMLSPASSWSM